MTAEFLTKLIAHRGQQALDGNGALQRLIERAIHRAHATGAQALLDAVLSDAGRFDGLATVRGGTHDRPFYRQRPMRHSSDAASRPESHTRDGLALGPAGNPGWAMR